MDFEENTLHDDDFGIVNTSDEELSSDEEIEENHKDSLMKLKDIDPAFYKFLQQNDKKLLKFNTEDGGKDESDDNDDFSETEELESTKHTPKSSLDVASDESDYEPSDDEKPTRKANSITLEQNELTADKVSLETVRNVMLAFNSALMSVGTGNSSGQGIYRVDGSAVFNVCSAFADSYQQISSARYKNIQIASQIS